MLRKSLATILALGGISVLYAATESDRVENSAKVDGIKYVALFVEDRETMSQFFGDKLGFEIRGEEDYVVYEVGKTQYFALVPKHEDLGEAGRMVVGFQVDELDDYFERIVEQGIDPLDPRDETRVLERPVLRSWGAREFAVRTPEGDLLIFTKMPAE